jgi:hypothetical protein
VHVRVAHAGTREPRRGPRSRVGAGAPPGVGRGRVGADRVAAGEGRGPRQGGARAPHRGSGEAAPEWGTGASQGRAEGRAGCGGTARIIPT